MPVVAHAQAPGPQPPGPFVIDVRGTTIGAPQKSNFYPAAIPQATVIPSRGFGLEAGAHVLPLAWGTKRIGFGAHVFISRATATTPITTKTSTDAQGVTTTTTVSGPDIAVSTRIVLPEMTINFGTANGWSYVGFGGGPIRVRSEAAGLGELTTTKVSGSLAGGARWFLTSHVGVGFDLRLMTLSTRTLFAASAGFSLK
jgi:hypothetical protein